MYSRPSFWENESFEFYGSRFITPERMQSLATLTHQKLSVYQALDSDDALRGISSEGLHGFTKLYFSSQQHLKLVDELRQGKLDQVHFRWLAKSLAYWMASFEAWSIVEVRPLEDTPNGKVVLTLDDVLTQARDRYFTGLK